MTDLSDYTIFLSHSSNDAEFVKELAHQIEDSFPGEKVFASSRPDAISSGIPWQSTIISNLDQVKVFIILITIPAENSVWVGFELGYFWKKADGTSIHALYHPSAKLPSPLDTLQGKSITDPDQVKEFFRTLSVSLKKQQMGQVNFERIVEKANQIIVRPPGRSLRNFERLLEQSEWDETDVEATHIWVCADDALFQIVVDFASDEGGGFSELWTRPFPDSNGSKKRPVKLNIAGVTIKRTFFISIDGGRYFVPMPDIIVPDEFSLDEFQKPKFVWRRNSLDFKLGKIISYFYPVFPTIEEFAAHSDIEIE